MYIEYIAPQRPVDPRFTEDKSIGGTYRPNWLIRTSDWKKVRGTEAKKGYCTLSYCWEQSGEMVRKNDGSDEYDLIDKGFHRVTKKLEDNNLASKDMEFEGVLQQICKDFGVDYLWYDKACINQKNKAEKHGEIKQMHMIYSNARFTIAFVPDIEIADPKKFDIIDYVSGNPLAKDVVFYQTRVSLWWKRSWTLEELMMSTQILIVGKNTYLWSLAKGKQRDRTAGSDPISNMLGFKDKKMKSASEVLKHSHFRTSTKKHDKIFALANIFHDIVSVDIDYNSNVVIAMKSFYRQLAERDLSVMCFGSLLPPNGKSVFTPTMTSYGLPSWTGVDGLHPPCPITDILVEQHGGYRIDDNMSLHLNCRSYIIRPTKYSSDGVYGNRKRVEIANSHYQETITSLDHFNGNESMALDWSQWCMQKATTATATHYWKPHQPLLESFLPISPLSLTEDCDECVIPAVLFGAVEEVAHQNKDGSFITIFHHYYLSPVLKSTGGSTYKAIGFILLNQFRYGETLQAPDVFLQKAFSNFCEKSKEFIIQ